MSTSNGSIIEFKSERRNKKKTLNLSKKIRHKSKKNSKTDKKGYQKSSEDYYSSYDAEKFDEELADGSSELIDDLDDFHEPYKKSMKRNHESGSVISDPSKKARGRPRKIEFNIPHDESVIMGTLLNDDDLVEDHPPDEDLIGGSIHSSDQDLEDYGLIQSPRAMLKSMRDEAHKKVTIEI
jgi:hypothetical protein